MVSRENAAAFIQSANLWGRTNATFDDPGDYLSVRSRPRKANPLAADLAEVKASLLLGARKEHRHRLPECRVRVDLYAAAESLASASGESAGEGRACRRLHSGGCVVALERELTQK